MISLSIKLMLVLSLSVLASLGAAADASAGANDVSNATDGKVNANKPASAAQHNNLGVKLASKGDWTGALHEHEKALQMDPYNPRWRTNLSAAHLEFGRWLSKQGKKTESMSQFRQAMIIDPENAEADSQLDETLRMLGKDPDSFACRSHLAEEAERNGSYDTSIVEWRRCVRLRDSGMVHARLGRVLVSAGKIQEGYRELTAAVSRADWTAQDNRELSETHRQLGDILKEFALKSLSQGKLDRGTARLDNASREFRRAVTICPENGPAIDGLLQCAQTAVTIKRSFDNHLFLGGAYLLAGKFLNAEMEYKECEKLSPSRPELFQSWKSYCRTLAGSVQAQPPLLAEAVTRLKTMIDTHTGDAELWYTLGLIRERQSDFARAQRCFDKAMSINPAFKHTIVRSLTGVSPVSSEASAGQNTIDDSYSELEKLLEAGKVEEVIARGQELFGKYPREGRFPGIVGRAYQKKGDPESLSAAKVWYRLGAGLGDTESMHFIERGEAAPPEPKSGKEPIAPLQPKTPEMPVFSPAPPAPVAAPAPVSGSAPASVPLPDAGSK